MVYIATQKKNIIFRNRVTAQKHTEIFLFFILLLYKIAGLSWGNRNLFQGIQINLKVCQKPQNYTSIRLYLCKIFFYNIKN